MFITLIKSNDKFYLLANSDHSVAASTTSVSAVRPFEDMYNKNRGRGYEASMSALIHAISFQPSVIEAKDVNDIKSRLVPEEIHAARLFSVAGSMNVVTARDDLENVWEAGIKPRIIS